MKQAVPTLASQHTRVKTQFVAENHILRLSPPSRWSKRGWKWGTSGPTIFLAHLDMVWEENRAQRCPKKGHLRLGMGHQRSHSSRHPLIPPSYDVRLRHTEASLSSTSTTMTVSTPRPPLITSTGILFRYLCHHVPRI